MRGALLLSLLSLLACGRTTPVRELPPRAREVLLDGDGDGFPGVVPYLRRRMERLLHQVLAVTQVTSLPPLR